jgi:two-component system phosphate regulon sensor histidine kinase PhoR
MASEEFGAEVELPNTQELSALADAFNRMSLRLDESFAENRRARMRWASAFASLSDGLLIVNSREEVTALNPAGARLLDADLEWAVGTSFVLVVRDHELISLLREALRRQETRQSVIEFARGDRIIEATAGPVAGFNEAHAVVLLRDVTELRRLETVRREFVANVSHELRTPIASIKAMVETLEAGAIEDRELTFDFLNRMVAESDRLAALVDDLLDLGRLETGRVNLHVEPLDPADLLTRAAERLRPQTERARVSLSTNIPAGLPRVLADRARIEQVILNLVHNAIKFTPPGGDITITAEAKGDELVVAVRDTGAGIALDDQSRLFERFYKVDRSRRSEGTGLGLAITKHIVQAHDGAIWVESELGHGATFYFTLPFAAFSSIAIAPN